MSSPVLIDCTSGVGADQIVRGGLALAAMTGRSIAFYGLAQPSAPFDPGGQRVKPYSYAVRSVGQLCNARVQSDRDLLIFEPQTTVRSGTYTFETGSDSATLLSETIAVPLARSNSESHVTIDAGTHLLHCPSPEYMAQVYGPVLQRAGLDIGYLCTRPSFHLSTQGEIQLTIGTASTVKPLDLVDRGQLRLLKAYILASWVPGHEGQVPESVCNSGADLVRQFAADMGVRSWIQTRYVMSDSHGVAVTLIAECDAGVAGFSTLGRRGRRMERTVKEVYSEFRAWWSREAACDGHMAEQLVIPLAVAAGKSRWSLPRVTEALRAVVSVTQQILSVEVSVEESRDGTGIVTVQGVG